MMRLQNLFRNASLRTVGVSRCFSSLPGNLILAESKIFEPVPEPKMKEELYYFPLLKVDPFVEVRKFGVIAGEFAEPVPLIQRVFEVAIRKDIVNDCIRYTRNKRRQPKKTKRMGEIRGSNKKPIPQKGGGRSQAGHKRNSSWRGGQKAHGPVLRDYSIDINRKVRALGMMMALAAKHREGNLIVFDHLDCETHKTKDLNEILTAQGLFDVKALFVDVELNEKFAQASGNLKYSLSLKKQYINVWEILKKDKLVFSKAAFQLTQESLLSQYQYAGKKSFYDRNRAVLQQAADFCDREDNGFEDFDYDDKDGNEGNDELEQKEAEEEAKKV